MRQRTNPWPWIALVALIVLVGRWTWNTPWSHADIPTGSSTSSINAPLPIATMGTVAPLLVILVTDVPLTPTPTIKPMPTYTTKPFCLPGQATPGFLCMGQPKRIVVTPVVFPTCPIGTPVAECVECIWMGP